MVYINKNNVLIIFLFSLLSFNAASDEITANKEMIDSLPPDQRAAILNKMNQADKLKGEIEEAFEDSATLIQRPELRSIQEEFVCEDCIYGYELFKFSPTTFSPSSNTPVPESYILGPGDKVKVSFYGSNKNIKESFINREGMLDLPILGPINLSGLRIDQASDYIKIRVNNELIGTDVAIALTQLRSLKVYILGEAYKPGLYTMSALSGVTNALFVSGGVNENGSLRNIQIKRNNKIISTYDFYEFLIKGSSMTDVSLQNGDVIFVPFIENTVKMGGSFKRPHKYEFIPGETINDAISLAGGYNLSVNPTASVELSTIDKNTFTRSIIKIQNIDNNFAKVLQNGDMLSVSEKSGILSKSVKISGEVNFPGEYSITPGDTILDLLDRSGGYTSLAYPSGAIFLRKSVAKDQKAGFQRTASQLEKTLVDTITKGAIDNITEFTFIPITVLIQKLREEDPLGRMVIAADYLKLKDDPMLNLTLQNGDSLFVPDRPDSISVVGEVLNTSTLSYDPELDSSDYINLAGGLNDSADTNKIFMILPNGQSKIVKRSLFKSRYSILPGTTIVVPRNSRPFDAVNLTQIITPVLADLATSAAAIAAISD